LSGARINGKKRNHIQNESQTPPWERRLKKQIIISIWNKEELPEERRSRSFYLSIRKAIKQIVVIIRTYNSCELLTILSNVLLSRLTP